MAKSWSRFIPMFKCGQSSSDGLLEASQVVETEGYSAGHLVRYDYLERDEADVPLSPERPAAGASSPSQSSNFNSPETSSKKPRSFELNELVKSGLRRPSEDENQGMTTNQDYAWAWKLWKTIVIIPESGMDSKFPYYRGWNNIIVLALLSALYAIPLHIAFPQETAREYMFWRRIMDILFVTDIMMQFFIAFKDPEDPLGPWVCDPLRIAHKYVSVPCSYRGEGGWIWFDLIPILPGFHETFLQRVFPMSEVNTRLAHLLILTRLLRMSQRITHFDQTIEATRVVLGFRYYMTEGVKFLVITTMTCHVAACVWIGIEGKVTNSMIPWSSQFESSWLLSMNAAKGDACYPDSGGDPMCVYMIALYWAMMTLTTVGYGDVTAQNKLEYVVCTVFMLISSFVWAYIVAQVVMLLSSVDPQSQQFKRDTDAVNALMESRCLPRSLRIELRRYMVEAKHVGYLKNQQNLLSFQISKSLQGKVAYHSPVYQVLMNKVWWVADLEPDAILEMVRVLEPMFFGPREVIPLQKKMMIMQRGMAAVNGKMLFKHEVYGADTILLESSHLSDSPTPRTLSYVDILSLHKEHLQEVCRIFPKADVRVRKAQIRTACFRAFIRAGKQAAAIAIKKNSEDKLEDKQDIATLGTRLFDVADRAVVAQRRSFANFKDEFDLANFLPTTMNAETTKLQVHMQEMEERLIIKMKAMLEERDHEHHEHKATTQIFRGLKHAASSPTLRPF